MTDPDPDERLGALGDDLAASGSAAGSDAADPETRRALGAGARLLRAGLLGETDARDVLDAFGDDVEPPPPSLPDDFELLGEIGRGGMGVVHRARQRSLDRLVAVKVLRSGGALLGTAMRRFEKEARALARLRHRHIVAVHEVGETEGQVWFTMDLIEGSSLEAALREGPLPPAQAVRILRQVASAVAYVHSHGLVHRDLKPANILLDKGGDAVVTDFGLAIEVGTRDRCTLTGQVLGTPAYMSPEQARGDAAAVGEATDVWAMGAVLYECLTGRRPFDGPSPAELAYAVIHADPPPPRSIDRRIPDDLESLCMKALAKAPQDRYATARAFLEDLERFDQGMPVRAQPPSRWRRAGRFLTLHRRNLAMSAASAAAAALVAGLAVAALLQRDPDALTRLGDELSARGEPGAAHLVYSRAVESAGETARQSVIDKAREAAVAEARALLGSGRAEEAVRLIAAAIAEGDRRAATDAWDGRARLRWERASAHAAIGERETDTKDLADSIRDFQRETSAPKAGRTWDPWGPKNAFVAARFGEALADLEHANEWMRASARVRFVALWPEVAQNEGLGDALERWMTENPYRIQGFLDLAVGRDPGHRGFEIVRRARRAALAAASRDPRTTPDILCISAGHQDHPNRPERRGVPAVWGEEVHRACAHLLAEVADLPVGIDRNWQDPTTLLRTAFQRERVIAAWHEVRDLGRRDSLRTRVEMAVRAVEAEKDRAGPWVRSVEKLPECDPQALRAWIEAHTGRRWTGSGSAQFAAGVRAWWDAHGQEDPAQWFVAALKLPQVPAASERQALVDRMRANPSEARWIHELLRLILPEDEPVPLLDPLTNEGDVGTAWSSSLSPRTPLRLRSACVALVGGRWQVVPGTSASAPLTPARPVTVRREVEWNAEAATTWGFHVPGLGAGGTSAPPTAEHSLVVAAELRRGRHVPRVVEDGVITRSGGASASTSHSGDEFPPGRVVALDANVGGERTPDPFRHDVTLAIAEPDVGAAPDWALDEWRARIASDAAELADRMARAAVAGERGYADVRLSAFFGEVRSLAALAASIPVPEARSALARIAALTGPGFGWADNARILRTARLLAGDAAALPEPRSGEPEDEPGRATQRSDDGDARRWLRVRLAADDPQIRALADERLRDAEWRPEDVRRAADAVAAGALDAPDWMRERIESSSASVRTAAGALREEWAHLLPPLLWLAAVAGALVSAVRTRRAGYAPLGAGAALVALGFLCDGIDLSIGTLDLLPTVAGAAAAAAGVGFIGPRIGGRAARVALAGFGGATVAGVAGLAGIDVARTAVAPLGMAVGVCALPAVARAVRQNPVEPHRGPVGATMVAAPLAVALAVVVAALVSEDAAIAMVSVCAGLPVAWLVVLPAVWSSERAASSARTLPIAFALLYALPMTLAHGAWLVGLTGLLGANPSFRATGSLAAVLLAGIALAAVWAVANLGHAGWSRWSRLR